MPKKKVNPRNEGHKKSKKAKTRQMAAQAGKPPSPTPEDEVTEDKPQESSDVKVEDSSDVKVSAETPASLPVAQEQPKVKSEGMASGGIIGTFDVFGKKRNEEAGSKPADEALEMKETAPVGVKNKFALLEDDPASEHEIDNDTVEPELAAIAEEVNNEPKGAAKAQAPEAEAQELETPEKDENDVERPESVDMTPKQYTMPLTPPMTPDMVAQMKHPLNRPWTLWYFGNNPKISWEDNQRPVSTVEYVEDFWALYHYTAKLTEITAGCEYALFRQGIKPMWEDRANCKGGRWVSTQQRISREHLDEQWKELMLLLIGEYQFDPSTTELINGAVVGMKKLCKLSVWLKSIEERNRDRIRRIGDTLRHILQLDNNSALGFETHMAAQRKNSSGAKYLYMS